MTTSAQVLNVTDLPGLDCGICGYRRCEEFAARLATEPALIHRCIHLTENVPPAAVSSEVRFATPHGCATCNEGPGSPAPFSAAAAQSWRDSLEREFDFYLEHFPEDPGPREIILPHNPALCREMDIQRGDIIIGRPLGMSCGCPITHCGVVMESDQRTGVMVWCVTGPLTPREQGFKDIGYYIAEGYEGLITQTRVEPRIGMRYYFQPTMCMLQWRHSGLVNYLNRTPAGLQVRLEGLWIG
jgi:uncharacterized Fe-S cluster-containing protein